MKRAKVDCLFLDMGKVLLDFNWEHFGNRMSQLSGVSLEVLEGTIRGLAQSYESGLLSDAEFHQAVCQGLGKQIPLRDFASAWNSIFSPDPILPEDLLRRLAATIDLWVISNTNGIHFDYVSKNYPCLQYFRGFVLSHEVRALKPDRKIFSEALSRARVKPRAALFVDDQMSNVAAARELGIDAFQFLSPEQFTVELQKRAIL
jgi:glucose-1-phosphatase